MQGTQRFIDIGAVEAWDAWFRWRQDGELRDVSIEQTWSRVAGALACPERPGQAGPFQRQLVDALLGWKLLPDERIAASAGTAAPAWPDDGLVAVLNAANFVRRRFDADADFDHAAFAATAALAVRMLDNAALLAGRRAVRAGSHARIGLVGLYHGDSHLSLAGASKDNRQDAVYRDDEGTAHVVEWVTQQDVDLARRISEVAAEQGLVADPSAVGVIELGLDTVRSATIAPVWAALLTGDPTSQGRGTPSDEVRDATGRVPNLWFGDPADGDGLLAFLEQALDGPPEEVLCLPVDRESLFNLVGLGFGVALTTGSALGTFYPEAHDIHNPEVRRRQVHRIIAQAPALAAYAARARKGQPIVPPAEGARIVEYGVRFTRPVVVDAGTPAEVTIEAKVGARDAAAGTARIDLTVSAAGQTVLGKAQVQIVGLPVESA